MMVKLQEHSLRETDLTYALPFEGEKTGVSRMLHGILIAILNHTPRRIAQLLFLLGQETRIVFRGVATYLALEVMYYRFPQQRKAGAARIFDRIWWNTLDNARSIWNRLLLVKQELRGAILEAAEAKGKVRILSIGSGSARPVLETLASLGEDFPIQTMLLDQDHAALEFSKELAQAFNLNHTQWVEGEFFRLRQHCQEFHPDVVELVGLLDYLDRRKAVLMLKLAFQVLREGGVLITGNIAPNYERPFVEKGVNWPPMIYRDEDELLGLLTEAGFEEIRIQREPLGIHMLAVARKPG